MNKAYSREDLLELPPNEVSKSTLIENNCDLTVLKEKELIKHIILPILYTYENMGKIEEVRYNHGSNEWGKDIFFIEKDFLGFNIPTAFVVKRKDITGKCSIIREVKEQVSEAFKHGYYLNNGDIPERKIKRVYIVTGGKFKNNAIQNLLEEYKSHSVFFIDGKALIKRYNKLVIEKFNEVGVEKE